MLLIAFGSFLAMGGPTAGSIDFTSVLSSKLPIFIAVVVGLAALLLRSLLLPAVLELPGRWTWALPGWLERALPRVPMEPREAADLTKTT